MLMSKNCITPDSIVADVLQRWPETIRVFTRHRLACIGCTMAEYETVSSAAEIYGLQLDDFLTELHAAVSGGSVASPEDRQNE